MLCTWFILFQFYDIKVLANFSNKIEKLVKFRLQIQKNPQLLCQKMTQIVKKTHTHCSTYTKVPLWKQGRKHLHLCVVLFRKVQTTLFSTPLENLVFELCVTSCVTFCWNNVIHLKFMPLHRYVYKHVWNLHWNLPPASLKSIRIPIAANCA